MYISTVPPPESLQTPALKPQSPLPCPFPSLQDNYLFLMTPFFQFLVFRAIFLCLSLALPHSQTLQHYPFWHSRLFLFVWLVGGFWGLFVWGFFASSSFTTLLYPSSPWVYEPMCLCIPALKLPAHPGCDIGFSNISSNIAVPSCSHFHSKESKNITPCFNSFP